jgi:hypothetical protein
MGVAVHQVETGDRIGSTVQGAHIFVWDVCLLSVNAL